MGLPILLVVAAFAVLALTFIIWKSFTDDGE